MKSLNKTITLVSFVISIALIQTASVYGAGNNFNYRSHNSRHKLEFFRAIYNGNLQKVKRLVIRRGVSVNARHNNGETPLYAASYSAYKPIAGFLVNQGAVLNRRNNISGLTPLMGAVRGDANQVVAMLVNRGARVNAKDEESFTALMYSAVSGNYGIARNLINKGGARLDITNYDGDTALSLARRNGNRRIVELIKTHRRRDRDNGRARRGGASRLVSQGTFRADKFIDTNFSINMRGKRVKTIVIRGVRSKAYITDAFAVTRNGSIIQLDELIGTFRKGTQLKARIGGRRLSSIEITANSGFHFSRSRGRIEVLVRLGRR